MEDQPVVNILTRTSGRPNYFKKCINSVREQTYPNINHIISVDDDKSEKYVKDITDNYIRVEKYNGKIPDIDPITKARRKAPYNLYLNDLREQVKEGWIMFLDDDDILLDKNAIEEMISAARDEDDLLIWKVRFPTMILPPQKLFDKHMIALNHFSMIGFMYNKKYDHHAKFDYFSGGDYFFISQLAPKIPKSIWIDKVYTGIQRNNNMGGFGKKDDLKENDLYIRHTKDNEKIKYPPNTPKRYRK